MIYLVEPPTLHASYSASPWGPVSTSDISASNTRGAIFSPVYEAGLPALRIEHNVVRVSAW